ncbi:E3 ubiquitin-protein ligase APD2 isoform X2 [Cicer arietinum]|uniref:Uncharacterized protein LOC101496542 isoform X2 n=1 Tax=Cicer arietinum TaxID=3827 RepID=A0A1S2Y462_CICAR|nr:uncharacterized protein LOC101496542 isoform X2 [Cicer arietinum]
MQRSLWLHQYSPLTTYQSLIHPIPTHYYTRCQHIWPLFLATLSIYFCVSASLLYGFYGDSRLILGPSSSRLIKTSSLFVKQIEVTNEYTNNNNNNDDDDVHLYGFNEKPELSSQINWTTSKFLLVEPYSRKGISLWLNKGSTICLRWEAEASSLNQLEGIVIKGERRLEKLKPRQMIEATTIDVRETENGGKVAEYMVEEDDRYHIGVLNMNPRNTISTMNINVSAKVYDTTKAKNMCSTRNGSCKLGLFFPTTYYVILSTPKNGDDDDDGGMFVDIAFMARVFAYIILLGVFMIIIFVILKCLEAGNGDNENVVATQEVTETEPLTRVQSNPMTYGTINKFHMEESDGSSSSSEELYDEKLCVICYDEQRNCFFVPCGHCATCYDCAQRIVVGESKVCPVCRRLIHKVRKLYNS